MNNWNFSYADDIDSLNSYYVSAIRGSYSTTTQIVTFNDRYSLSGVSFHLPVNDDGYSIVCLVNSLYFEYIASPSDTQFTGITLNSGDIIKAYGTSDSSENFKIECSNSNVANMPNPAYLSSLVEFYIGNVPSAVKYPYTFQNGYLFVFDLGGTGSMYSFDLISKSEEYSDIGDNPFPDTNQSYWFDNSLPETDLTVIPSSSAITIHWDKGDKTNIFGQTQDMVATINGTSDGRYLYIYNPPAHYKWSGSSNPSASETINYPVTINGVSSGDNFYIYDSRALLFDFNQGGKVQGTVTGETGYGSVSNDGAISVVTSNGAVYTQNSGGSTDISGANGGSLAENINGLKQAFDDAINNIILLISTPVEYIQRLIGLGGDFVQSIASFFDFLPEPLNTMVITGISVVIVVGVLHTLL